MKNKTLLVYALFLSFVVFCLGLSQPALAATSTIFPLPDTTEGFHLGIVHEARADIPSERGVVDYVWGAKTPTADHSNHKQFYIKFDRSGGDPGNSGYPLYYDKQWYLQNHPDWLVYLCDRKTLAYEYGDPHVPIDISNPAVRQFVLNTWIYPAFKYNYDGIAFDNVNLDNMASDGRCGVWTTDQRGNKIWKYLYGDEQSIHGQKYVDSVLAWARDMYTSIHRYRYDATMAMNYCPNNGGDQHNTLQFNEQLLPYSDFMLGEGGFTNGRTHYTTDNFWQLEAGFARDLAAQGKGQLLIFTLNYSTLTIEEKQWALANYLLVKGKHTYMYISSSQDNGNHYGPFNVIPEYSMNIGHPINLMYQSQGVYMRDYSNGKTLVNPSAKQSFAVTIPAGVYTDTYGNPISGEVTLNPHSGLVLLTIQSRF